MPAGTEMLPLIVGQAAEPALPSTEVVEEAEVVEGEVAK
jgi:HemY protein